MSKLLAILMLSVSLPLAIVVHGIELEKKDYLALVVGNYVHGFNEFDTSIVTFENAVRVGIYYDQSTQDRNRAVQLSERFRTQIPKILMTYPWADEVEVTVSVYSEDRTGRGYK